MKQHLNLPIKEMYAAFVSGFSGANTTAHLSKQACDVYALGALAAKQSVPDYTVSTQIYIESQTNNPVTVKDVITSLEACRKIDPNSTICEFSVLCKYKLQSNHQAAAATVLYDKLVKACEERQQELESQIEGMPVSAAGEASIAALELRELKNLRIQWSAALRGSLHTHIYCEPGKAPII